jgi:hypothetical protein
MPKSRGWMINCSGLLWIVEPFNSFHSSKEISMLFGRIRHLSPHLTQTLNPFTASSNVGVILPSLVKADCVDIS